MGGTAAPRRALLGGCPGGPLSRRRSSRFVPVRAPRTRHAGYALDEPDAARLQLRRPGGNCGPPCPVDQGCRSDGFPPLRSRTRARAWFEGLCPHTRGRYAQDRWRVRPCPSCGTAARSRLGRHCGPTRGSLTTSRSGDRGRPRRARRPCVPRGGCGLTAPVLGWRREPADDGRLRLR